MSSYFFSRLKILILSLFFASLIIFFMIEIIPGDPASFMLGINAEPETVDALRKELGLDISTFGRYFNWITGMFIGDFGVSYTYRVPVSELVMARIGVSIPLALYAIFLSTLIAIPIGIFSASNHGNFKDWSFMGFTQLGIAIPNFWFAMVLVLIFSIYLKWFSAGGVPGWDKGFFVNLKALTLPAFALALPQASILARIMRSALIETLSQDYFRTARASGLTFFQAVKKHAFRNALIPVLTIIGLQFSFLIAGAIIIENVFFLPGIGRLIFQGIVQRDLIVVESVVMLLVFSVIIVNFLVDMAYLYVDPRLRVKK